jgi:hypothetical protein
MDAMASPPQQSLPSFEGNIITGDAIFEMGQTYLKGKNRRYVYIYAPTGVWKYSEAKLSWFQTIADCLRNWSGDQTSRFDPSTTTKLMSFIGVYGFPPVPSSNDTEQVQHFAEALNIVEKLLLPFNAVETAHLHYLRTDTATIPGTGTIIIDDSVFTGFAVTGRYSVDYGLFIQDRPDIAGPIAAWFTQHVMSIANNNTIQDVKEGKTVKQGINEFRRRYNLPEST